MKIKQNQKHDKHIALGLAVAYLAGMIMTGLFFGLQTWNNPEASTGQASEYAPCPPTGATPEEIEWYITTGQCQ